MCDFCNAIVEWKDIRSNDKLKEKYKCAYVIETYKNRQLKSKFTSKAYKLNFCPMCGRELTKN